MLADAALALDALKQRSLLAANIRTGADAHIDVEGIRRTRDPPAENRAAARCLHRSFHRGNRMRVLGPNVDISLGRADREGGNRHTFDQHEGVPFHDHSVRECAAVTLIGVADDVFLRRLGLGNPAPFDASRKPCTAATA